MLLKALHPKEREKSPPRYTLTKTFLYYIIVFGFFVFFSKKRGLPKDLCAKYPWGDGFFLLKCFHIIFQLALDDRHLRSVDHLNAYAFADDA